MAQNTITIYRNHAGYHSGPDNVVEIGVVRDEGGKPVLDYYLPESYNPDSGDSIPEFDLDPREWVVVDRDR